MIAFVKGRLDSITDSSVVIESNDIGYEITVSSNVINKLPKIGEKIKLYTYLYVREDICMLYGFNDIREKETFISLIGISGIGPKGAIAILSELTVDELAMAVLSKDTKAISKASGIGTKTAERVIIDLRDKVKVENMTAGDMMDDEDEGTDSVMDAVMALTSLGYSKFDAMKVVKKVKDKEKKSVEQIIKEALKYL
ncbi:Holliday junction DNA helicase subunit RuvA [Eubacterium ruminantium]|nr:Holliday junction DNA helicase subunit RuvA [Eubacterium ruminantium]